MIRHLTSSVLGLLVVAGTLLLVSVPAKADGIGACPPTTSDCLIVHNSSGSVAAEVSATEDQESDNPGKIFFIDPKDLSSSDLVTEAPLTYLTEGNGKQISDLFGVFKISKDDESYGSGGYDFFSWLSSLGWSSSSGWSGSSGGCSIWDWGCGTTGSDKYEYVLGFISDPLGDAYKDFCSPSIIWGSGDTGKSTCVSGGPEAGPVSLANYLKTGSGLTGTFQSDSEVPEPATTGLLGGLAVLALCAWKRRKAA